MLTRRSFEASVAFSSCLQRPQVGLRSLGSEISPFPTSPTIYVMILCSGLSELLRALESFQLDFNKSLKTPLNLDPSWASPITSRMLSQFPTLCLTPWYLSWYEVGRGTKVCASPGGAVWFETRVGGPSCKAARPRSKSSGGIALDVRNCFDTDA